MLVDEYDKPILDALEAEQVARANRDYLRGLYATIKDCDGHVRFCFLTGVSKFSKVSLFSGLNNLDDITLDPSYSSICGFTEENLEMVFAPELEGLDRERIRDWYNGYSWGGAERVYNPFDVLLLLRKRKYKAWWFETGTPTFLVRTLAERQVHAATLEDALASEKLLGTFDVGRIATEALLFQTGYLTVAGLETENGREFYRLGYPNREVRESLNESLLDYLTGDAWRPEEHLGPLRRILREGDFAGLEERIRALFAAIPHDWYRRNNIDRFEGHYASVMYAYFASLGQDVRAEESGSGGRGGPGAACGRPGLRVRVQGCGAGGHSGCDCAAEGAGLRGQVPTLGRAGASGGSGVRQADAQRREVRDGTGVTVGTPPRLDGSRPTARRHSNSRSGQLPCRFEYLAGTIS